MSACICVKIKKSVFRAFNILLNYNNINICNCEVPILYVWIGKFKKEYLLAKGWFRLLWGLIHLCPTPSYEITTVAVCLCVGYHLLLFHIHWASSLQSGTERYIISSQPYVFIRGRKPSLDIQKTAMLLCQRTRLISRLFVTPWFSPTFSSGLLQLIPFNFVSEKGFIIWIYPLWR